MRYFEDFPVGTEMALGPYHVSADEIVEFASEFDPQPFHLDGESAQAELTGGLIASGWHTCAMAMRMFCDAYILDAASEGAPGVEEVRWLKPVRPGDTLSGTSRVTAARVMRSRPHLGIVSLANEVRNQHGEVVCTLTNAGLMRLRDP